MTNTQTQTDALRASLERAGLGPIAAVHELDVGAVQVELAETAPMTTIWNWTDFIDVIDARAGQYDANDEYVRLHLRGSRPGVGPVVVTQPLHTTHRARQAQAAWEGVSDYDASDLIEALSEME